MLSVLRPNSPATEPKAVKFKSVLGLAGIQKDASPVANHDRPAVAEGQHQRQRSYSRRSVDTISSYKPKRRSRVDRASADISFDEDVVNILRSADIPSDMPAKTTTPGPMSIPSRRGPARAADQEGPWTISVAETPHDASAYSLYVRSEFLPDTPSHVGGVPARAEGSSVCAPRAGATHEHSY